MKTDLPFNLRPDQGFAPKKQVIDWPLNVRYGGIALLFIGPALMLVAGLGALHAWQVQNWPTTTAQVVNNNVEVSKRTVGFSLRGRTANADYFTAQCTYKYEIDGQRFIETGTCAEGFDRDDVERLCRPYSVGAEIAIHYSPSRPQDSQLTTDADTLGLGMMFGFGLAAIPGGLVMIRGARKMQPEPPARESTALPAGRVQSLSPQEAAPRRASPASQSAMPRQEAKRAHWLLRTLAVCVGVVFVLFGGVFAAACLALMAKGAEAPAAAKVGMTVQVVATVIFALVALFGAFLIWVGLRRGSRAAEVAYVEQPMERAAPLEREPIELEDPSELCVAASALPAAASTCCEASPRPPAQRPAVRERRSSDGGFGQLIARCGPEKDGEMYNYVSAGIYLTLALLCIIAPGRFFDISIDPALAAKIALLPAGLGIGAAILYLWEPLFGPPQTIELYEHGIVEQLGKKVRSIELAAIEHLRVNEWYEHRFAARTFNVKAQVDGQRQLAFNTALRGEGNRIIEYLASQVPQTEFVEFDTTL